MADKVQNSEPNMLESWIQILLPQPCYDEFFIKLNFLNVVCLKVLLSKCLGYGIILGSVMVKLPQIIKIISAKSGEGISMMSVLTELVAISSGAAYGWAMKYPFSAYGEGAFLMIQTTLIGFFVLAFNGKTPLAFLFIGAVGSTMGYLLSPATPMSLLTALQASNMPIVAISKFIQIIANFRNGSTGQLSAITLFLLFFGSLARIFTSVQETGDNLVILTYVVASVCNGILVTQLLYYWNSGDQSSKKQKQKKRQ